MLALAADCSSTARLSKTSLYEGWRSESNLLTAGPNSVGYVLLLGAYLPLLMTPRKTWPLKLLMAAGMASMFGGPLMILAMAVILHSWSAPGRKTKGGERGYVRSVWRFGKEGTRRTVPIGLGNVGAGLESVLTLQ